MDDRLLSTFRTFLIAWAGYLLAHTVYLQAATHFGAVELPFHAWKLWHPMYFGVVNATFVLVPFLLFQVPTARRFGGWSSAVGRAIILFGLGTVLWGMGNLFWFTKNVQGTDAPYPSLADAGYLAVLPLAGAALYQLAKVVGLTSRDWRWLPLALLIATPINAWIMLPQFVGAGTFDTTLSTIISTTYIISDVVLLGVSIIVALGARRAAGGRFFAPVLAVTASMLWLYVGDIFFNYRIAKETFYNGDVSDFIYGIFILSSCLSAWLFLRADVRAKAAAQQAHDDWHPEFAHAEQHDGPVLEPLDQLATAILTGQERVLGAASAHAVASGVAGVERDSATASWHAVDAIAIDALVRDYRALSGPLGEMACWTAARPVLARHPELVIPSLARFRNPASPAGTAPGSRDSGGPLSGAAIS